MNKILLYTYNPFKPHKINSAKELVIQINIPNIKKVFLDINYDLSKLYKAISEFHPDIVIGVGQSLVEKKLSVETTFRNWIKNDQEERIISETPYYLSNLPVKEMVKILGVSLSSDAETRNCNFSAYCLLQRGQQENFPKVGFIHVPSIKDFKRKAFLPKFEKMLNFLQQYKF